MTNDMMSDNLSIIRLVVRTKVLFFLMTEALTTNFIALDRPDAIGMMKALDSPSRSPYSIKIDNYLIVCSFKK